MRDRHCGKPSVLWAIIQSAKNASNPMRQRDTAGVRNAALTFVRVVATGLLPVTNGGGAGSSS